MKSAEGQVQQSTPVKFDEGLQKMAERILETLVGMDGDFGQNYVAQFLTGDHRVMFRKPHHRELQTFGTLTSRSMDDVIYMIHYLINRGFIQINEPDYSTIRATQAGKDWLADPQPIEFVRWQMRFTPLERQLRSELKDVRRRLASENNQRPFEIMTDFMLDRIALAKPLDLNALREVPGVNTLKCERYGAAFLHAVHHIIEFWEEYKRASLLQTIKGGSYPKVKEYFLEGLTVPEIARGLSLKLSTVCGYLYNLHLANAIDLVPWIEQNVNPKVLFKAVEYFERVRRPSLTEAHHVLGIDWNTLRFCRLYAQDKAARAATPALAS